MRALQALFRPPLPGFDLGLENLVDGKIMHEIEHVYYVELEDFTQLGTADSMMWQEQWEIKLEKTAGNAAKGKLRVRAMDLKDGSPIQYILTTKVSTKDGDNFECETETTQDMMILFKFLAEKGMRKERYSWRSGDLVWEVDVFRKPNGDFFEWVKVDLEVPNKDTTIPEFPLKWKRMITEPYGARKAEDEKLISSFYDGPFIIKNEYQK